MSSRDSSTKAPGKTRHAGLAGRRILVVEDSPVVGAVHRRRAGRARLRGGRARAQHGRGAQLIDEHSFDAALMDVHIRGERVFPLCEMLEARGVPFILTSGYADWQMPDKLARPPAAAEALYHRPDRKGAGQAA